MDADVLAAWAGTSVGCSTAVAEGGLSYADLTPGSAAGAGAGSYADRMLGLALAPSTSGVTGASYDERIPGAGAGLDGVDDTRAEINVIDSWTSCRHPCRTRRERAMKP